MNGAGKSAAASTSDGLGAAQTPPSRKRSSARRDLVQNQIYESAAKLFALKGFAGTNLQDIADEMGISRPALYHYVDSKETLLFRLVEDHTESVRRIHRAVRSLQGGALDKLHLLVHKGALEVMHSPHRLRLIDRSEAALPPQLTRKYEKSKRETHALITAIVAEGVANGTFLPVDEDLAARCIGGMLVWLAWWYHDAPGMAADTVADEMFDIAVHMLRPCEPDKEPNGMLALIGRLKADLHYLERMVSSDM